jgi:hypothetical protein
VRQPYAGDDFIPPLSGTMNSATVLSDGLVFSDGTVYRRGTEPVAEQITETGPFSAGSVQ